MDLIIFAFVLMNHQSSFFLDLDGTFIMVEQFETFFYTLNYMVTLN